MRRYSIPGSRRRVDHRGQCPRGIFSGFTVLELLTVVVILAVLAAILIPTLGGGRNAALRAQTRVQFSQWAAAFESHRQEYGSYPPFPSRRASALINEGVTADPRASHWFHDALAGVRRDGTSVAPDSSTEYSPNSRGIRFHFFHSGELVGPADVAAGHNSSDDLNLIRDAFHHTSIAVVVDANRDGMITAADVPEGLPAVAAPDGGPELSPSGLGEGTSAAAIRAGVIFYTAGPGATTADDLILSWR